MFLVSSKRVFSLQFKKWAFNQVDYERGQEAKLLLTVPIEEKGPSLIAISPDSYSVAVTVNTHLMFYDGLTGNCDQVIENIFNRE